MHSAPPELAAQQRYRRTLERGILLFRWVWLAWMTTMAAAGSATLDRPLLAWISIGVAGAWTVWLSAPGRAWSRRVLVIDVAICAWLVVGSGVVVAEGQVVSGRPFFATGYPMSAALLAGAATGMRGGVLVGLILGIAHVTTRPLNGVGLNELTQPQLQNLLGAMMNYIVAGGAVGLVAKLMGQSAESLEKATRALIIERERAARLAERESLARQIHDSVLQTLALVHKRGRELAQRATVPGAEVAPLAELAAEQEAELRTLILRDPEDSPTGRRSLRHALETLVRSSDETEITVSSVGPIWLPSHTVGELTAAVRQALDNVTRHAAATRASVFAEHEDGVVTVTVRDDGRGFAYDEQDLRSRGKAGLLKSMKGRVEDLSGTMMLTSGPSGTEVEFRVPVEEPPSG